MKVVIQKPDLDTCLTAIIMSVSAHDQIVVTMGAAAQSDLKDPNVLCIEAGGSGQVDLNNFDHHEPGRYYPPACRQACDANERSDAALQRLVDYVCHVDEASDKLPRIEFPALSSIFSGMLLTENDKFQQFYLGMSILRKALAESYDPYASMPDIDIWRPYRKAKELNKVAVEQALLNAERFTTSAGLLGAWLESRAMGGVRGLYHCGCSIVVMLNPTFGFPPTRKITISGNNTRVSSLLPLLNSVEKGWGGRDAIIGSPREGTQLPKEMVLAMVKRQL